MLLAIDIGNTSIISGIFSGDRLLGSTRVATAVSGSPDRYWEAISGLIANTSDMTKANSHTGTDNLDGIIISSVVPELTNFFSGLLTKHTGHTPLIVKKGVKTPVKSFEIDEDELGADRLVNASAGITLYKVPLIIVDFGTATTFCVVDKNAVYLGGAISPGIAISSDALFTRARRLKAIPLSAPEKAVGKSTHEAMNSGIVLGHALMVDSMIDKIEAEIKCRTTRISTGGYAHLLTPLSSNISITDEDLTLKGLSIIFNMNRHTNTP